MWTRLDNRELATVLAALRTYKDTISENPGVLSVLQPDEIDKLCERLNSTDTQAKPEYIEAARGLYAASSNDDIEVDDDAASSRAEDEDAFGTWVMGWLFVRDEETTGEVVAEDHQEATTR
jgi:hypothetical protein